MSIEVGGDAYALQDGVDLRVAILKSSTQELYKSAINGHDLVKNHSHICLRSKSSRRNTAGQRRLASKALAGLSKSPHVDHGDGVARW